ncbi:ISAs1 family transposase, partial [Blastochloris sulfoviridis]
MRAIADTILDAEVPRARLALLLQHFSELDDAREPWRVMYPLHEVLLLVTCATIASCDDFDDIAAWGKHHLRFLQQFADFHHGIPCERWLRCLVNRVDPVLFARCFEDWVAALWPGRHDLIAIDGKTARRTHDRRKGLKALHTLSAYATTARLVLAQTSVPEKTNEITAIPALLDQLAEAGQLDGALVSIDAMGCQADIAANIVANGADYLLALKSLPPRRRGATSQPSKPMWPTISAPRQPRSSSPRPPSRRATAASRPEPTPPPAWSTGSPPSAAIRASRASPPSGPLSAFSRVSSMPTAAASRPASTSPLPPSTLSASPVPSAAIGASRACTGCSTLRSRTTCRATEPAMAPRTWPSSAASPSASC